MDERTIFERALDLNGPEQRAEFLAEACGQHEALRRRVDALLRSHEQAGSFLHGAVVEPGTIEIRPVSEQPGDTIGPYTLLQQIGEGGMGTVFMAEQIEPVERHVALKIIKPGMDTQHVIARFEAERQALAMMNHPHIAKVLDAGTTESGRPYFVMELVNGISVTEYCDRHHLTPRERLDLFATICQAVQHAHQKGIIHRDLKPSNILVAQYDDRAVPKIIDFGVAKATRQRLTEKTIFTQYGQIVGTVEYMSPEQAQFNQLDVDTRSDIYSLGVLLYELLTGETPFDKRRLRSVAFDELLRILREEEPPKPSTKLSGSETLADTAASRKTDPRKLSLLVRGELDWIVTKALEKDRGRRYETASAFAADIQHYLNGEAVAACPPSAAYRFRKFAQRNKVVLGTTAAIAASLIAGIVGTSWQAYRATQAEGVAETRLGIVLSQRDEIEKERQNAIAEAERADREATLAKEAEAKAIAEAQRADQEAAIAKAVNDFLNNDLLKMGGAVFQIEAHVTPDPDIKLRTLVDRAGEKIEGRFADQPLVEAEIRHTLGRTYRAIGAQQQAERQLHRALELRRRELGREHPATAGGMYTLAWVYHDQGRYNEAEKLHQQALLIGRRTLGDEHPATLSTMASLADIYRHQGRHHEAEQLLHQTHEIRRQKLGNEHPDTLSSMNKLALVYLAQQRLEDAERLFQNEWDICRRVLGDEHPRTLGCMHNLALVYLAQERLIDAERLLQHAWEIRRQVLGGEHPDTLRSRHKLALVLYHQDRHDEAEQLFQETLEIQRRELGEEHPDSLMSMHHLANLYLAQMRHAQAERLYQNTWDIRRRVLGDEHPDSLKSMHNLAVVYDHQHRYAEAERLLEKTLEIRRRVLGDEHSNSLQTMCNLATVYLHQCRYDEAERLYRELLEVVQRTQCDHDQLTNDVRSNLAILYTSRTSALATTPKLEERNPDEAVRFARLALELKPDIAKYHSNLGVALYRNGQYIEAVDAFEKGDELRQAPDFYHRMFYAMAEWQLGHRDRAFELYREGADWMKAEGIVNGDQLRFRDEAEKLLGVSPIVKQDVEQPLRAPPPTQTTPKEKP